LELQSAIPKSLQRDHAGRLCFSSDPDRCCYMNKVQPMEALLWEYDIWINGVRKDQSQVRNKFCIEQCTPQRAVRFHPMLDWNAKIIFNYIKEHNLPEHPLDSKGFQSIGCEPCTQKTGNMNLRGGRWFVQNKVECGLHIDLVNQTKRK